MELTGFEQLYQASREIKCFLERPVLQEAVFPTTNEVVGGGEGETSPLEELLILGNLEKSKYQ